MYHSIYFVLFFFFQKSHLGPLTSLPIQFMLFLTISILYSLQTKQQKRKQTYRKELKMFDQIKSKTYQIKQTNKNLKPPYTHAQNKHDVCFVLVTDSGASIYPGVFLIHSVRIFWRGVIFFSSPICLSYRKLLG